MYRLIPLFMILYDSKQRPLDYCYILSKKITDQQQQRLIDENISKDEFLEMMDLRRDAIGEKHVLRAFKAGRMHLYLNRIGRSMADLYADAGETDLMDAHHAEILKKAAALSEENLQELNALAMRLSRGWQVEDPDAMCHVPIWRYYALKRHRQIPLLLEKGPKRTLSTKEKRVSLEKAALQFIYYPSQYVSENEAALKSDVLVPMAKLLDVSLRWLFGFDSSGSFYGFSYDNWTLLNPHARNLLEARINDKAEGKGNHG